MPNNPYRGVTPGGAAYGAADDSSNGNGHFQRAYTFMAMVRLTTGELSLCFS